MSDTDKPAEPVKPAPYDYSQDPAFRKFSDADKHAYMTEPGSPGYDAGYVKMTPHDQIAYRRSFDTPPPTVLDRVQQAWEGLGNAGAYVAGKGHDIVAPVRAATDAASDRWPAWLTRYKDPTPTREEAEEGGRLVAHAAPIVAATMAAAPAVGAGVAAAAPALARVAPSVARVLGRGALPPLVSPGGFEMPAAEAAPSLVGKALRAAVPWIVRGSLVGAGEEALRRGLKLFSAGGGGGYREGHKAGGIVGQPLTEGGPVSQPVAPVPIIPPSATAGMITNPTTKSALEAYEWAKKIHSRGFARGGQVGEDGYPAPAPLPPTHTARRPFRHPTNLGGSPSGYAAGGVIGPGLAEGGRVQPVPSPPPPLPPGLLQRILQGLPAILTGDQYGRPKEAILGSYAQGGKVGPPATSAEDEAEYQRAMRELKGQPQAPPAPVSAGVAGQPADDDDVTKQIYRQGQQPGRGGYIRRAAGGPVEPVESELLARILQHARRSNPSTERQVP